MNHGEELPGTSEAGGAAGRVNILQANRDAQSNWEVDLAKNLEEYLLKICSGEIPADNDPEHIHHSVNFAEAALLLQGSVQVYSRKVEYLYSLVLHALEFLSQKRQDQQEKASTEDNGGEPNTVAAEDSEPFLGLDDVPVEAKNCLDNVHNKDDTPNNFVKPPANLLVLEGGCLESLDTSGDAGELESYLLATCDFCSDFLLLDPCDAGAIYEFLKTNSIGKEQTGAPRGISVKSITDNMIFKSPSKISGGQDANLCQTPMANCAFETNNDNLSFGSHEDYNYRGDDNELNVGNSTFRDDSDDDIDNPWIPLNPHEPGNLKIKPFRKGKFGEQQIRNAKRNTLASQFPVAKLDGVISQEFAESFEVRVKMQERHASLSPPLYEKLRRSLTFGLEETFKDFGRFDNASDDDGGNNYFCDFSQPEFDPPANGNESDLGAPLSQRKKRDDAPDFEGTEPLSQDDPDANASLEDLCGSHLDALLASIAESEKQTQLAARVSTWKQRIEHNLEEQESHPSFDIHLYGERILEKLSLEAGTGRTMSFTDIVIGQPKHEVARTFSALLQLVNNENVDLQRAPSSGDLVCHTCENPFHVRLLRRQKRREDAEAALPKKRVKTPAKRGYNKANSPTPDVDSALKSSPQNSRISVQIRKASVVRCSPERKRRKSRSESVNLHFAD